MHGIDIKEIVDIAKKAGEIAMSFYGKDYDIRNKDNKTPVTEADLAINKFLLEELSRFGYPILSEESEDDFEKRKNAEYVWIVDPLDGTSDFIQKTGEFSVLIGLVRDSQPILGVVFEPVLGNLYFAEKNKGSFLEKDGVIKKIYVSSNEDFAEMTILLSRNHLLEKDVKLCDNLKIGKRIQRGSTSKMCLIAAGKAEIYVNTSDWTGEWDTCAPGLVLQEAGGRITDLNELELFYNNFVPRNLSGFIASNGFRHENIIKELMNIK